MPVYKIENLKTGKISEVTASQPVPLDIVWDTQKSWYVGEAKVKITDETGNSKIFEKTVDPRPIIYTVVHTAVSPDGEDITLISSHTKEASAIKSLYSATKEYIENYYNELLDVGFLESELEIDFDETNLYRRFGISTEYGDYYAHRFEIYETRLED